MSLARYLAVLALGCLPMAGRAGADTGPPRAPEPSTLSAMAFVGDSVRGFQNYPFELTDGDQKFVGVSAAWVPLDLPLGFRAGLDGGLSVRKDGDRFGPPGTSAEAWLGPTLRHSGITLGPVIFKPSLTVGLSAVSESYGLEAQREQEEDGDAALLYYYGPEIALSLKAFPRLDLTYRLHHRSGAEQVENLPDLGSIGDTMNANVFGLRYHF